MHSAFRGDIVAWRRKGKPPDIWKGLTMISGLEMLTRPERGNSEFQQDQTNQRLPKAPQRIDERKYIGYINDIQRCLSGSILEDASGHNG